MIMMTIVMAGVVVVMIVAVSVVREQGISRRGKGEDNQAPS
jgi:hypothetical protein